MMNSKEQETRCQFNYLSFRWRDEGGASSHADGLGGLEVEVEVCGDEALGQHVQVGGRLLGLGLLLLQAGRRRQRLGRQLQRDTAAGQRLDTGNMQSRRGIIASRRAIIASRRATDDYCI